MLQTWDLLTGADQGGILTPCPSGSNREGLLVFAAQEQTSHSPLTPLNLQGLVYLHNSSVATSLLAPDTFPAASPQAVTSPLFDSSQYFNCAVGVIPGLWPVFAVSNVKMKRGCSSPAHCLINSFTLGPLAASLHLHSWFVHYHYNFNFLYRSVFLIRCNRLFV